MRIPFPERIPLNYAILAATILFAIQVFEGTAFYFAVGTLLFIIFFTLAFNEAGGLSRASGAYVFFYGVLVFLIGVTYKAFLGEPAESNLKDPKTTIEVFVGGMAAMLFTTIISRRFRRKSGLLEHILKDSDMYRASVGCIATGILANYAIALLGQAGAQLQATFGQLNQLVPLGIILAVTYEIRSSGGTRSINLTALAAMGWYFFWGLLIFSKQGMLTPLMCWILPVWTLGYRLSRAQVLLGLAGLFLFFHYLVPYAQYGRSFVEDGQTLSDRIDLSVNLLENIEETRRIYLTNEIAMGQTLGSYYDTPQGFWERLQFISADDALINVTDQGKVFGLSPIPLELMNAVPHIFWKNKPVFNFGNLYAHEIGGFSEDDTTTGISFSPTGEAYHLAKWLGVFLVAPLIWFSLFVIFDSLLGNLRATPWGLLAMVLLAHTAPETGISGAIYVFTFGTEIITFCAIFATWAAPPIASAFIGPRRPTDEPVHHSRLRRLSGISETTSS
ncbi:MAG TPA: hypothetical protein VG714_00285 [Acidobacteriaceae bacterium]|nr:hypothetical protein [Acidobacteriaceae bacterium]